MSKKKQVTPVAPAALLEFAKQRTANVTEKLRKAMSVMEQDIEENGGLYPYHGGRITQSEVCRRAGISKMTLQGVNHKSTNKVIVDAWVARATQGAVQGKRSVRKVVTERADAWKEAHAAVAQAYHKASLTMIDLQSRIKALEAQNAALREQLAVAGKRQVVALPKRAK